MTNYILITILISIGSVCISGAAAFFLAGRIIRRTKNAYPEMEKKTNEAGGQSMPGFEAMIQDIKHRDTMLEAVNKAAVRLLSAKDDADLEASILESMELVSRSIFADRIHIWQSSTADSDSQLIHTYCWFSETGRTKTPMPIGMAYPFGSKIELEEKFSRCKSTGGIVSQMSGEKQASFTAYDIKTMLAIPLFFGEQFWGMLSIDDCKHEREFTEDNITILRSVGFMMANAIERHSLNSKIKDAHNRTRILLDKNPLCCQLWDSKFKKIDCNEAAIKLFGFKTKQELLDNQAVIYPEYQSDGMRSDEKAKTYIEKAFHDGQAAFNWTYRMLDGSLMPAEVILFKVKHMDDYLVAGYTRDLREYNKMMDDIEYRGKLMQAVNQMAVFLHNSDDDYFEEALHLSMDIITDTVKVDCVYIWKNHRVDEELWCSRLFEWSEKKTVFHSDKKLYKYSETLPGWEESLKNGEYKNGLVCDMPQEIQALLAPAGIISILVVPIFIKDYFWGFVGFDDCRKERVFTEEEVSILHSASLVIANSFIRNEMILDIRESSYQLERRDHLLLAVNLAASQLLAIDSNEDMESKIVSSLELVGRSIDADRVSIWRNEVIDGVLYHVCDYNWCRDVWKQKIHEFAKYRITFDNDDRLEWKNRLSRGEYISGPASVMDKFDQAYLDSLSIKSIVIIPLFMHEEFWGLFIIDDFTSGRDFNEEEIDILRSVSLMMLSTINRSHLMAEIDKKHDIAKIHLEEQVEERTSELALQTATLTTLFDSIPDLIFTKDLNLNFMHCNKAFFEHFGSRKEDVIGKNDAESLGLSVETLDKLNMVDRKVISKGQTIMLEETIPNAKKTDMLFETTKMPLMMADVPVGLLSIAHDITKTRERELRMAANYEYANKLSEALAKITKSPTISAGDLKDAADVIAKEGCIALNVHSVGIWLYRDGADFLENISCYDSSIGEHFTQGNYDLSEKPDYLNLLKSERRIVMNNPYECMLISGGNEEYEDLCAALDAPIRIDGKLAGAVCAEQYRSDKYPNQREWMLGEQNFVSSLGDLISLSISSAERHKAREDAEFTNRSKSIFLANMSHEIRTPMNAILGITEILMQNNKLPFEIVEGLEKIYISCDLLMGIINDILDFSKIEAGKMHISPAQYKVASLLNDTVHLNILRIENKPVVFEINVNENVPAKLIGDELRIKQILNNLLSNAIKYTDSGKITFSVDSETMQDEVMLILSISDTGHGMTEEQLGRLFEEYTRFNQGKSRYVEGTGLGLSITQRLVNLMDGDLHIKSEIKKGSLFRVKLPQKMVDDELLGREVAENLMQFRMENMMHRERRRFVRDPMPYGRILVVDDVETNLFVAEGLMKLYRLQIDTSMNGHDVIDKIKNGNVYDIIFMDHMMPEMDGIETTKHIRELGYSAPIIALTANAVAGQAEIFLRSGFDEFISKPIDVRQLNSVLNKFVRDVYPPQVVEAARMEKAESNGINHETAGMDSKTQDYYDGGTNKTGSYLLGKKIAGLDIARGLRQYNMDETAYLKILRSYAASVSSMLKKIETVKDDKLDNYRINVHGIKGTSLEIFAEQIGNDAGDLEKAAKTGDFGFISGHNRIFLESAWKLVSDIENMLKSMDSGIAKPKKDKPDNEVLEKLLAACIDYDIDEADKAMAEMEKYHYDGDEGLVDWLRENIDQMNYKQIEKKLSGGING